MKNTHDQHGTGGDIGAEAANHVDRHSASYCASERQRIETVNRPAILALHARVGQLRAEERDLEERIYQAPPPGDLRARRRKANFRYAIAVLLTIAAFIFSVLAFDPYQLGWKAWLYCLGIAVVTPFLVDRILDRWASPRLVNVLATVAGIAAIVSLILLGSMKGDVKRYSSPHDWKALHSRGIQPLCSAGQFLEWVGCAAARPCSVVPFVVMTREYSFVRIRGDASKTLVAVATLWFYRRLEAYSFVRLSEGA